MVLMTWARYSFSGKPKTSNNFYSELKLKISSALHLDDVEPPKLAMLNVRPSISALSMWWLKVLLERPSTL